MTAPQPPMTLRATLGPFAMCIAAKAQVVPHSQASLRAFKGTCSAPETRPSAGCIRWTRTTPTDYSGPRPNALRLDASEHATHHGTGATRHPDLPRSRREGMSQAPGELGFALYHTNSAKQCMIERMSTQDAHHLVHSLRQAGSIYHFQPPPLIMIPVNLMFAVKGRATVDWTRSGQGKRCNCLTSRASDTRTMMEREKSTHLNPLVHRICYQPAASLNRSRRA